VIEVRLFGHLRSRAGEGTSFSGMAVRLPLGDQETVGQVLDRLGIAADEIGNLFLNGRLLPRSVYPLTLGYPLATPAPLSMEECFDTPLQPGDRLGVFPRNMGLVVV
jgi:molybdopterin converting factor small subunit